MEKRTELENENETQSEEVSAAQKIQAETNNHGNVALMNKKDKHPIRRGITMAIVFLLFIGLILVAAFARQIFGDEIGDLLFGENVQNGFQSFAIQLVSHVPSLIVSLVIIVVAIAIFFILNVIIRIVFNKTQKSRTIGSLIKSCVKYVTIIVAVALILTAWGVDVASIVAGLGVLTLIVGLGCQTLIQDVVSGIFIVFDDYFSVGDLVIIDGFRGTVTSIGLKATKITDPSGNIKSISNSSINTVVNVSRLPTMITVNFDIGFNEDLERVEGVIDANLAEITKRIPQLTEGLYYKGVDNFTAAGVSLLFLGYCAEPDRFQVVRDVKREIYLMCRRNDINVPFNQITVNPQDPVDRPKATEKQKKGAAHLDALNHPAPAPKETKKKRFREVAREAFKDEFKEMEEDRK